MNHGQDIISLFEELKAMPEQQSLEKISRFRISLDIFNGNFSELIYHLGIHNNPRISLKLMAIDQRNLLYAYQKEITRLLHNYISSALSLMDHARKHYRELYSDNNLFPDYQEKINQTFSNNPLAIFIKDLRQYFQHYQMPGVSSRLVCGAIASNLEIRLLLPIKEMKEFSGWSSFSKKFLSEQTDDIDLLRLVNEYHQLIINFYDWFISRQMEIHTDGNKKVEDHISKIRALEISNYLTIFVGQSKSKSEFESEIFRYFPDDELKAIKNSFTRADRVENMLKLLKKASFVNFEQETLIRKIYSRKK